MITAGGLIAKLFQAQKELQEGSLRTPASDMSSYNRLVGRHQGLEEAINIIRELKDEE